jgi:hypothetical protein
MQRIKNPSAHNFAPAKQGVGGLRPARRPRRTRCGHVRAGSPRSRVEL